MQVVSCYNFIVICMVTKSLAVYFVWSIDTAVYVSKANACAFNL